MRNDNGFGDFDGRVWLNCAHQGALPDVAAQAVADQVARKQSPHRMTDASFVEVPQRLRTGLGTLLGVPAAEVILGNSTTYGLHLLAHGLRLDPGDEVLLVDGDFPATVVPWQVLRQRGVRVRLIRPAGAGLTVDDLAREATGSTRVVCTSAVFSFTGYAVDLAALGGFCRDRGITFVVNASQALGARELDLTGVDALVSCGHKWLCGPYATGLCWLRPDLLDTLDYAQPYWQQAQRASDLGGGPSYEVPGNLGAPRYDVFATANFFNVAAWTASVEHLLSIGVPTIAAHDQTLVDMLVTGLDPEHFRVLSPPGGPQRSTLVLLSDRDPDRNPTLYRALTAAGIDVAYRGGSLRVAPHLYNDASDIERTLDVLHGQPR